MANIEFKYLYRDGCNWKKWGSIVFSNSAGLPTGLIQNELDQMFLPERLFIARQVRVPEIFLYIEWPFSFDDHCYHEFAGVYASAAVPNDLHDRSIGDFVAEVSRESARGWREFDPYDSPNSIGWLLARSV